MKKRIIKFSAAGIGLLMLTLSCGGGASISMDSLKSEKGDLQARLVEIDSLLDELDTNKKDIFYPLVVAKPVITEDFEHQIEVLGLVSSDKNVVLSAEYNGKIVSIQVKEGQKVSKGQTIAVIDGQALNDNTNELETQLEYAEYMLDKQIKLNEKGVGSEFNVKQAENQVNSLKDKMKSLGTMKGKTVVRAPFSGVVEQIMPNTGEFVGPGAPIARVVNVDKVTISSEVSEQLLGNLKEGSNGTALAIKFDHLDSIINTTIQSIGKFIDPINRTVKIRTELDKNTVLLPNMTGKVAITDASIANAKVIPSTAILKDENNNQFIYILDEKQENGNFSVAQVWIKELSSFKGKSAIESEVDLTGKEIIDQGAKGITKKDIVKLKIVTNE